MENFQIEAFNKNIESSLDKLLPWKKSIKTFTCIRNCLCRNSALLKSLRII